MSIGALLPDDRPQGARPRRLAGEVYDAAQRARSILSEAEAEACRLRAEAQADCDRMRAAAVEVGRQAGLSQVAELLTRAALERDRLLAAAGPELLKLALSIAGKILEREVAKETPVLEMAARALEEARQCRVVLVRVHPEDQGLLREHQGPLEARLAHAPGIAWRADPAVARGGVVVETERGSFDAQLDTQLAVLRDLLEGVSFP